VGPSFSRAELRSFTGATLPDLISDGVRLLFAGINPGLRSVAVQGHFAPRGNRFYPALLRAGLTGYLVDASAGLTDTDRAYLLGRGIGITSLVARATASADELGPAELTEGTRRLTATVRRFRPRVVAILGITAYRTAFAQPRATTGRQPEDLEGAQLWVVPNPAGATPTPPWTPWPPPTARSPSPPVSPQSRNEPQAGPACGRRRHPCHCRRRDRVRVATADACQPSASGSAAIACGGRNGGRGRLGSRTPASPGPLLRRMNGTCSQTQTSQRLRPAQGRRGTTPLG
jgi:TDG/mug DNA glycosylase family protein